MLRTLSSLLIAASTLSISFGQGADDCANAEVITGPGPHAFDNTAATTTPGLSDCNGNPVHSDVWFRWTAPSTARVTVEACGLTSLATRAAVYQGTDCGNLVQLTCAASSCPSHTAVRFQAAAGEEYLIRFGSQTAGETGTGSFQLELAIPTLNPNNGSYYEIFEDRRSWTDARGRAEALQWIGRDGHLVIFNDQREVEWVAREFPGTRPWIGLYQDPSHPGYSEPGGGWVWVDGSELTYSNWIPGEPNNTSLTGAPEGFAEMLPGGAWNDAEDDHLFTTHFLVEYSGGDIGSNFCVAAPNSTGAVGAMSSQGSLEVATNLFQLTASSLPQHSFGVFLASQSPGFTAAPGGSQGNLCLSTNHGRFSQQVMASGHFGTFTILTDTTGFPTTAGGSVAVAPGETWYFQAWHRELVGGTATTNFTDGLEVTFL